MIRNIEYMKIIKLGEINMERKYSYYIFVFVLPAKQK